MGFSLIKYVDKVRMKYCPFCGRHIQAMVRPGITSCGNCGRVFDTCSLNRTLSYAWLCRRESVSDPHILDNFDLTPEEIRPIVEYVVKGGYSHDEFYKYLKAG